MKKVNSYDAFSEFYDDFIKITSPDLHPKYLNLVKDIISKFKLNPSIILDSTCGTGLLMEKLINEGYKVEGLDLSSKMLEKARKKGLKVFQGDIRNFNLKKKYDIILSFDSFGHLTTDLDLLKALINLKEHLLKGGILLIDGGTREKANKLATQEFKYNSKNYSLVWKNKSIGHGKVNVELNIKKFTSGGAEEEYIEEFQLCGHELDEIKEAVEKIGLKLEFITIEPLAKKGSFICCCRNI